MARRTLDTAVHDDGFVLEIDRRGDVLGVECRALEAVPHELIPVAVALIEHHVAYASFVFAQDDRSVLCHVSVHVVPTGQAATITGQYRYELPFGLTRRELDVLTLVALGISNAQIASRLSLSARTITTHVDHIMRKMGVISRTATAVIAVENGLLKVPFPADTDGFEALSLGRALRGDPVSPAMPVRQLVKKPLMLGAAVPLHGTAADDGTEMVQSAQLAIDEFNARGGIDGRLLSLEVADIDIMDPDSIRRGLCSLASRDVNVLTSGYFAHQDVAHEVAADWGIPYLHAATLRSMEEWVLGDPVRYGRIFQVCPSDVNYAPRFVEVMSGLRDSGQWLPSSTRLVVVQNAFDLTDLGLVRGASIAERDGWQFELISFGADSGESWAMIADRIRRSEPAAVMLGHYFLGGTLAFLRSFLAAPPDTLIYALYAPSLPGFRTSLGTAAEGIVWATTTGTYSDPLARAFAARYRRRFGTAPGRSHAGIAYDRVRVAAQAWAQAADPRNPDSVAAELRNVIHRGVNGVYYLGGDTQTARTYPSDEADPSLAQAHLVFQIQDGRQRILSPVPYADTVFRPQPWLTRTHRVESG
ncbi:MAG TPA: ABC transporter substrate-binding protein [Streptosporangiaceae bacterium]|nr:ABC transporter substrate-binding protein [Streptosporangiaceae bacterium]